MSPDEAAFLKAISDNPADETARLVYADWLAERDDSRAAFARLSADFLRSARGLADTRHALPREWVDVVDPLFDRFHIVRLANAGEGIEDGTVTAMFVRSGSLIVAGQALADVSTDKASLEITAEHSGVIVSVFVRPGDRIPVGQPLVAYLALQGVQLPTEAPVPVHPPQPPWSPVVPREPLVEFIEWLGNYREELRTAAPARIDQLVAHLTTAARIVFGGAPEWLAQTQARENRGWGALAMRLDTQMQNAGFNDEQMAQERLDIQIETLRVLLQRHGQPDRFHELPDDAPPATE